MKKILLVQKWAKPILVMLIGVISIIVLSGCSTASQSNSIHADSPGIFNHYFIYPFSIFSRMYFTETTVYPLC